jgi:formyl-CoA transferase
VFIENSRPGKMASLGLGPDDCKAINPQLIYASASGFGDGGPLRDRAAYDSIGQSMSGFYSIMNDAGSPRLTGTCVADLIAGIVNAAGVLAALVGRSRRSDGRGAVVRTSLLEAMSVLTIDAVTQMFETSASPTRQTRHPQAQNFCLLTSTGDSITLHLSSSEKFWRMLVAAMDREDLLSDPRFTSFANRQDHFWELKLIVETEFLKRSRVEWEERLTANDVPFAPVLTVEEVARDPQTEWLQMIEAGDEGHTLVRAPWRFDGERPHRGRLTPALGQHSIEIASEVCAPDQVAALIAANVILQDAGLATRQAAVAS